MTVRVLLQWSCLLSFHMMIKFSGTTFSLSVPMNFFDYNNILISMKKGIEHISVNTVRTIFLLRGAVQNIFGNTGGRVLMLAMTACGNFAFTWIF